MKRFPDIFPNVDVDNATDSFQFVFNIILVPYICSHLHFFYEIMCIYIFTSKSKPQHPLCYPWQTFTRSTNALPLHKKKHSTKNISCDTNDMQFSKSVRVVETLFTLEKLLHATGKVLNLEFYHFSSSLVILCLLVWLCVCQRWCIKILVMFGTSTWGEDSDVWVEWDMNLKIICKSQQNFALSSTRPLFRWQVSERGLNAINVVSHTYTHTHDKCCSYNCFHVLFFLFRRNSSVHLVHTIEGGAQRCEIKMSFNILNMLSLEQRYVSIRIRWEVKFFRCNT